MGFGPGNRGSNSQIASDFPSHPKIAMQHCFFLSPKSLAISGSAMAITIANRKNRCDFGALRTPLSTLLLQPQTFAPLKPRAPHRTPCKGSIFSRFFVNFWLVSVKTTENDQKPTENWVFTPKKRGLRLKRSVDSTRGQNRRQTFCSQTSRAPPDIPAQVPGYPENGEILFFFHILRGEKGHKHIKFCSGEGPVDPGTTGRLTGQISVCVLLRTQTTQ